jgi:hypothetical protein
MHVCRQLRAEYLPLCLRSPIWIDWMNVPRYLNTFFPIIEDRVENIDKVPSLMTILIDPYDEDAAGITINILHLWRLSHGRPKFNCRFAHSDTALATADECRIIDEHDMMYLKDDEAMFRKSINHVNERWQSDIESGNIVKIAMSLPGLVHPPRVQLIISNDFRLYLLKGKDQDRLMRSDHLTEATLGEYALAEVWRITVAHLQCHVSIETTRE